jgi:hypothetical protein
MNKLFLLPLLLISFLNIGLCQNFNIDTSIKDSINQNLFHYRINGVGNFNDSCVLKVELLNSDDFEIIYFFGEYDFRTLSSVNLLNFYYDKNESKFYFDLGDFENSNMSVHMWTLYKDEKISEIYYK